LGADEGGHPTPAGGVLWGVKSRGLAIRLNSYLTAEKEIVWRVKRSRVNGLLMSNTFQKLRLDLITLLTLLIKFSVI
jgi:hypothetical protein